MNDVTSTTFGYIIGFLLPGSAFLLGVLPRSITIRAAFESLLQAQSTFGIAIATLMAALLCGMLLSGVRFVIFEHGVCRKYRTKPELFKKLGTDEKTLQAFRAVVDEHYRYHQFWGGIAVVTPFVYWGWARVIWSGSWPAGVIHTVLIVAMFALAVWLTVHDFKAYCGRATKVLEGV